MFSFMYTCAHAFVYIVQYKDSEIIACTEITTNLKLFKICENMKCFLKYFFTTNFLKYAFFESIIQNGI